MKLKYILKKTINFKTSYLISTALALILIVSGYFSYALFTVSLEAKGALNIVTGSLRSLIESDDLDSDKSVSIEPNTTRIIELRLINVNSVKTKVNLYYQANSNSLDIGYLKDGDIAPTNSGYVLEENGANGDNKTIFIKINNNDTKNIKVTFGSDAGLSNAPLAFPENKKSLILIDGKASNTNIIGAYTYNEDKDSEDHCITGEEETCKPTNCYENEAENSCEVGTIIKYKVKDDTEHFFYVLHDDGEKMTLQQRENTIYNVSWYTNRDNTKGPLNALTRLEEETTTWVNVNDQTYKMGETTFLNNANTGCLQDRNCSVNTYTFDERTAKARMITLQEAYAVNCLKDGKKCPMWMWNYLDDSIENGGTKDDIAETGAANTGYWTMSAQTSSYSYHAWLVSDSVQVYYNNVTWDIYGARAVIEINK